MVGTSLGLAGRTMMEELSVICDIAFRCGLGIARDETNDRAADHAHGQYRYASRSAPTRCLTASVSQRQNNVAGRLCSAAGDPHGAARFVSKELRQTRRGPFSIERVTRFRIELAHELDQVGNVRSSSPFDHRSHGGHRCVTVRSNALLDRLFTSFPRPSSRSGATDPSGAGRSVPGTAETDWA